MANRKFDLIDFFPNFNLRQDTSGDYENLIDGVFQFVLNLFFDDLDLFKTVNDPDIAPDQVIPVMIDDLGNPFKVAENLSLDKKRRLIKILIEIYLQKGTIESIIGAIRFFFEVDAEIIIPPEEEGWVLGEDILSDDVSLADPDFTEFAILGFSSRYIKNSFQIKTTPILNSANKVLAIQVINQLKPAYTHFLGFEDDTAVVGDNWELNISELETESDLH